MPIDVVPGMPQPTADLPPGAAPLGMGTAVYKPAVPTAAQAIAGVPIAPNQQLPPQQQGVAAPPITMTSRANSLIDRVGQGFRNLLGISGATQSENPMPVVVGVPSLNGAVSPAAQAAVAADASRRAAAPSVMQRRMVAQY